MMDRFTKSGGIPFNKPFLSGRELSHIESAINQANLGGDGLYTSRCAEFIEGKLGIARVLMTSSCSAALEIAVAAAGVGVGDEVILPSFTFVSTANAVTRLGARPVFVDIRADTFNLDESLVEAAITGRTRAMIAVHYAGVACEMDALRGIAKRRNLVLIEDAAPAFGAAYKGAALGSLGHMGCFSFHETKNLNCGQGGALGVNSPEFHERAQVIRDRGTNRQAFRSGLVPQYTWMETGSAHAASELACAYLWGQLENLAAISARRRELWLRYAALLDPLEAEGLARLPVVPPHCEINHHSFHLLLPDQIIRDGLISHLRAQCIQAVSHYVPLHSSPMGARHGGSISPLPVTEAVSGRIVRLPLFHELTEEQQSRVAASVLHWLRESRATNKWTMSSSAGGFTI